MNNNYELTIAIKGLEVTTNGCTCEDIQFTSKGNFGNEYVAVLGDVLNRMLTKIPDAVTPTTTTTTTNPFCEIKPEKIETPKTEQHWDLPAVWEVMIKQLPEGFKKDGIGCYAFEAGTTKDKNKITVKIEFTEDSIDMDIYVGSTAIHGYLYPDGKRSRITGINPALMSDIIDALPEDIREYIAEYLEKITK